MSETEQLQAEIERLRGTLDAIFDLAPHGSTVSNLAAQALENKRR
jgi:hypothetical protein